MIQATPFDGIALENDVVETLRTIYDPEIPVNIYDLGLVYSVDVAPDHSVAVQMTLTSPACPVAQSLPADVEWKVRSVPGVKDVKVEVVWDPPWTPERMTEEARLELGLW
jgi:FeS assembly SUF system protein